MPGPVLGTVGWYREKSGTFLPTMRHLHRQPQIYATSGVYILVVYWSLMTFIYIASVSSYKCHWGRAVMGTYDTHTHTGYWNCCLTSQEVGGRRMLGEGHKKRKPKNKKQSKGKCHKWLIEKFPFRITCLCGLGNLFFNKYNLVLLWNSKIKKNWASDKTNTHTKRKPSPAEIVGWPLQEEGWQYGLEQRLGIQPTSRRRVRARTGNSQH